MLLLGFHMNAKPNISQLMQQFSDMTIFLVSKRKLIFARHLGHHLQSRHSIQHAQQTFHIDGN